MAFGVRDSFPLMSIYAHAQSYIKCVVGVCMPAIVSDRLPLKIDKAK